MKPIEKLNQEQEGKMIEFKDEVLDTVFKSKIKTDKDKVNKAIYMLYDIA